MLPMIYICNICIYVYMYVYIYMYTSVYIYICNTYIFIYSFIIYIYIEREREREREMATCPADASRRSPDLAARSQFTKTGDAESGEARLSHSEIGKACCRPLEPGKFCSTTLCRAATGRSQI